MSKGYDFDYMQFFHKEWMGSNTVGSMSAAAEGIFLRLILKQWENEAIPGPEAWCMALARATDSEWAQFAIFFPDVFPVGADGNRRNPQQDSRRQAAIAKIDRLRENGGLGGRPKGSKTKSRTNQEPSSKPNGYPYANPIGQPNAEPSADESGLENALQVISNKELTKVNSPISPKGGYSSFREFLDELALVYPENRGRKIPTASQTKLEKDWRVKGPEIVTGAKNYGLHREFLKSGNKFCPAVKNIQTWVNQRCWQDEYEIGPIKEAGAVKTSKPREGTDFELHFDSASDKIIQVKPGTTEPFNGAEWLEAA